MNRPIHRIAVPNPFFEGRNSVYLVKCDPLTLIDTGVATDKAYAHLIDGLGSHGVTAQDIRRVVLTHKHIDHIGNAWRFQQDADAQIFIHDLESKSLVQVDPSGKRFVRMVEDRMAQWHVPPGPLQQSSGESMPEWRLEPCRPSSLGDELPSEMGPLQVIHTPGHTMGSTCLKLQDALFSGDHVLETISPNVGGGDMRSTGMLRRFLSSLDRVMELGDVEVFPGHGTSFRGLVQRCEELKAHHRDRLALTLDAVSDRSRTVYEVAIELFGELKRFHIALGCAEANAHLEWLVEQGEVKEHQGRYQKS